MLVVTVLVCVVVVGLSAIAAIRATAIVGAPAPPPVPLGNRPSGEGGQATVAVTEPGEGAADRPAPTSEDGPPEPPAVTEPAPTTTPGPEPTMVTGAALPPGPASRSVAATAGVPVVEPASSPDEGVSTVADYDAELAAAPRAIPADRMRLMGGRWASNTLIAPARPARSGLALAALFVGVGVGLGLAIGAVVLALVLALQAAAG